MTRLLYLLGYPVQHSLSPVIYNEFFKEEEIDAVYKLLEVPPGKLGEVIRVLSGEGSVLGFNVTAPHKVSVTKYLASTHGAAATIGAVNCVVRARMGFSGLNTDWLGFRKALNSAVGSRNYSKALIIGAGGAGRAALYALRGLADEVVIVSRTGTSAKKLENISRSWSDWVVKGVRSEAGVLAEEVSEADLIVNASPVGAYPEAGRSPVPTKYIRRGTVVFDMVYNPLRTRLLKEAGEAGAVTVDGLEMLVHQAVENIVLWFGVRAEPERLREYATKAVRYA